MAASDPSKATQMGGAGSRRALLVEYRIYQDAVYCHCDGWSLLAIFNARVAGIGTPDGWLHYFRMMAAAFEELSPGSRLEWLPDARLR